MAKILVEDPEGNTRVPFLRGILTRSLQNSGLTFEEAYKAATRIRKELGDSAMLATAAYNAGQHRVTRWLPDRTLPADIWIELVPFSETRGYLRRVLAYTVIYEKRMGRTPTRLEQRLHPVPPDISLIGAISGNRQASAAES